MPVALLQVGKRPPFLVPSARTGVLLSPVPAKVFTVRRKRGPSVEPHRGGSHPCPLPPQNRRENRSFRE